MLGILGTVGKYVVGAVALGAILVMLTSFLPKEFSFYTLDDFETSLGTLTNTLSLSFETLSQFINLTVYLYFVKIVLLTLLGGFTIKLAVFVINILGQGGA